jgi:error-prone DNA polymerase
MPVDVDEAARVVAALEDAKVAARARPSRFVELCARSNFSFLAGASSPEALVRRAVALGYDAFGLADLHGLYGMVRAHETAKAAGLHLVVGAEVAVFEGDLGSSTARGAAEPRLSRVVLHVENRAGYTNLCRVLTAAHSCRPRDERALARAPLAALLEHPEGLFATFFPHVAPGAAEHDADADGAHLCGRLAAAFGSRLSVGMSMKKDGLDRARLAAVTTLERTFGAAVLASNDVRFAEPKDKPVLDVLTCIREGLTLDRAGRRLAQNAEGYLKSEEEMQRLFSLHPSWLARSRTIADACTFSLTELRYKFPFEVGDIMMDGRRASPRDESPDAMLARLTWEGARARYPGGVPDKVRAQIDKELALIARLEVAPYFLSVRAIVDIARARDILCQGRGSAANSAVCFCLGITAVDPARSSLLFERFLSAERKEPPDIDVDFEHERREEVIQEIYARYGRERAAMVSEVISYRGKSALREVGKAFGLSLEQVDRLSDVVSWWDGPKTVERSRLEAAGFDPGDERVQAVLAMAAAIQGFPRHLSIHVGGFVLSAEPLVHVAPVEPATMPERTVIPWDKDDIDTLGFFKVDVLGLGMLTAIRKALDMVKDDPRISAPTAIDRLARIPAEEEVVYDALCRADTVGVFQIESRAQMAMLPRLRPRCFYDLVIEVAIVRPGPIQGGMVHPYLRRRNGEERPDPPHPILGPILDRTLGVPLFQEQVMQIAITGAGYSGGEADQLRRDMAAWRKNGNLARHEARLMKGFRERGISRTFGERLFSQIQGFGEYGFPESHAASFALLVYASSWLKVHHPAAFAAALVNSQPMGFYSPSTLLKDAQRHGVRVLPPTVAESDWDCTVVGGTIRVGLRQVKGLGEDAGRRVVAAREAAAFSSVDDLAARARLDKGELVALAEAGTLDALTGGRREAIWGVVLPRERDLFAGKALDPCRVQLPRLGRAEQLVLDYERTGLSVDDHPMLIARPTLGKRVLSSREVARAKHGRAVETAGLVICRQRPATASGVVFGTLEDEHGFVNLVLWAPVFERLRHVATTASLVRVRGKIERQGEVVHVVVSHMTRLALREPAPETGGGPEGARLPSMSRDFH